jgi:hypothetical protein
MKELGSEIHFLKDNLTKQYDTYHHYETRANFTLAISSGLLFFAITQLIAHPDLGLGLCVIIFTAFLSMVLSLLTIKPPKFMRKKRQSESLFYHSNIFDQTSSGFVKKVLKTSSSREEIIKEYAQEIYNLVNYSIKPRRIFSQYITNILVIGITIGLIIFLFEIL